MLFNTKSIFVFPNLGEVSRHSLLNLSPIFLMHDLILHAIDFSWLFLKEIHFTKLMFWTIWSYFHSSSTTSTDGSSYPLVVKYCNIIKIFCSLCLSLFWPVLWSTQVASIISHKHQHQQFQQKSFNYSTTNHNNTNHNTITITNRVVISTNVSPISPSLILQPTTQTKQTKQTAISTNQWQRGIKIIATNTIYLPSQYNNTITITIKITT